MDRALMLLMKKHVQRREDLTQFLANGSAKDYAEYRGVVGQILSLSIAIQEIDELAKRLQEDEDDD